MVEPAACAIHGVLRAAGASGGGGTVLVLGAGTLGLCAVAALRQFATPGTVISAAKYPEQRRLAAELGADVVAEPDEARRAVRRVTGSMQLGSRLSGGADVVIDCVGSEASVAEDLAVVRPGGLVVLLGMPATVSVDLTPLWQRQITLVGSYAYGLEAVDGQSRRSSHAGQSLRSDHAGRARTFDLAFELVADARLDRLVSASYPLDRYREAIDHAANAGRRGAIKVVFDLRGEKRR
jgi:threonine dehydrogenase-like Zn-dependent dehydrogenase